jgi:hypothetical protein
MWRPIFGRSAGASVSPARLGLIRCQCSALKTIRLNGRTKLTDFVWARAARIAK